MNEDGTDAFVIADKALDSKPYNSNGNKIVVGKKDDEDDDYDSYYDYSCTWSNSTLREWLNSEFINEAFNKNEQAAIIKSTIKTEGEEDAEDKVFIISQKEARDTGYGYGMPSHEESYYYPRVLATNYAGVNGAWVDNQEIGKFWYRTPGNMYHYDYDHRFDNGGVGDWIPPKCPEYRANEFAVCPAMHIDLTSKEVTDAGEVDSYGKEYSSDEGYNNPRINDDKTIWDCVYFGNYYQDCIAEKEPIEWKVLSVDGNDAFIMADKALYSVTGINASHGWQSNSDLRGWLNKEFINDAFDEKEQNAIKSTVVDKFTNEFHEEKLVEDKVYVLSIDEACDEKYGFEPFKGEYGNNPARSISATDYALMYCKESSGLKDKWWLEKEARGNVSWWLRDGSIIMSKNGIIQNQYQTFGIDISCDRIAVCPVMHIDLSLADWENAGTVSVKRGVDSTPLPMKPLPTAPGYNTPIPNKDDTQPTNAPESGSTSVPTSTSSLNNAVPTTTPNQTVGSANNTATVVSDSAAQNNTSASDKTSSDTLKTDKVTKVTITGKKTVRVGKSITLKARLTNVKGTVKWSVDKKKIATINSKTGKLKGKKPGKVRVTAKVKKVKGTVTIKVKK